MFEILILFTFFFLIIKKNVNNSSISNHVYENLKLYVYSKRRVKKRLKISKFTKMNENSKKSFRKEYEFFFNFFFGIGKRSLFFFFFKWN